MQRDPADAIHAQSRLNRIGQGRHFLQIPGPTPVPDRVLRAIDFPTIDHRGPEFQQLALRVLKGIGPIFGTAEPVVIYSGSGTGAWEAAMVNTLSPGDAVLMHETGQFAGLWTKLAEKLQLKPECIPSDWRSPVDPDQIESRLRSDTQGTIKAVCVVHNETSTGVSSDIAAIRKAIDAAGHPALLMVDCVSSIGAMDYRHDAWGVDVTVAGSQKGLMLPPGLGFNAVSAKARDAAKRSKMPRAFWAWEEIMASNAQGFWPTTPNTNLLYGLAESIDMLMEEGLSQVFARHHRLARATRAAATAWGLETVCRDPAAASPVVTALYMPNKADGTPHDGDLLRREALQRYNISLGTGLGRLAGKAFRIGHLGDTNALTIIGALAAVEMTFAGLGMPHQGGGVQAAMRELT